MADLFNITKRVGQLNEVIDHRGKKHYRGEPVKIMLGENNIVEPEQVYDTDHFIFQFNNPITKEEYEIYKKQNRYVPVEKRGICALCSCGSEAVVILDSKAPKEIQNKLICKSLAQFGIHQTSYIREGNTIRLPKQVEQDHMMLDSDMEKLYGKIQ